MNENNIKNILLTNKVFIEKQNLPTEEEEQKKDLKLLYQVTGQNFKLSNLKRDIGIFLELTDYIFNDIKSISDTGKNVKNLQYNSKIKINNESLYNNKVKSFNNNLELFKKKFQLIKEKSIGFKNVFQYIKRIKHFGFLLDEKFDIYENDMILDLDKFIIHHKLIKNFEELINIKNKNFKIINSENGQYKLQSDFFDYYNNKYVLDFNLKITTNNYFSIFISNELIENYIKEKEHMEKDNKEMIVFYIKYLLYKFFKEETNSFRNLLKKESKEADFLNKGLNFNIIKYINNIILKCYYFDNLEIILSITKIEKEQYIIKPNKFYYLNINNNKNEHQFNDLKYFNSNNNSLRRIHHNYTKFFDIFLNNILFDIKASKKITNFISDVKKNNNLIMENIIKNSIFVKNLTNLGLILLKKELSNYLLYNNNGQISAFYLNIYETPLGKYKIFFEYHEKAMKFYYIIELVFDNDLNLTIIIKEPFKNLIFNLDQGQVIYVEKGRINFNFLNDILSDNIVNFLSSNNSKYNLRNNTL